MSQSPDLSEIDKLVHLGKAAQRFMEWFNGIGLDHIPNQIYHDRGGYQLAEALTAAIEEAEPLLVDTPKPQSEGE